MCSPEGLLVTAWCLKQSSTLSPLTDVYSGGDIQRTSVEPVLCHMQYPVHTDAEPVISTLGFFLINGQSCVMSPPYSSLC